MTRFGTLLLAATLTMALAASPAVAQQSDQQMPMMGQGGMMGGQGGMMSQGDKAAGQGMMGKGMMGGRMMGDDGKPDGQGMMGCPMMGGDMMGMMMGTGPMMEGRLAYLKAELGITEGQTAAWDDYVAAVKARHAAMQDMHAGMMQAMQSGNAMERLDAHIKAMESMVESLKALKPATVGLYAVLNDDQKKKADLLLSGGCGMM